MLFISTVVNKTWLKELKDTELLYTGVSTTVFFNHLRSCSGGLHAIDVIDLTAEMMTYYKEYIGITEYINMLEEDQFKSNRANIPISNDTIFAIATNAMLSYDDFPCTTDKWEYLDTSNRTWYHWNDNYSKA